MRVIPPTLGMITGTAAAGIIMATAVSAAEKPPADDRTNLAADKPVRFAPTPRYSLTRKGGTDATDLTDGRLTRRDDQSIWFDSRAVGWRYAGRVNLAVDLGQPSRIDEVAIRLCGRTGKAGASIPGWIEVLVSDDGEHYREVSEFSHFKEGSIQRFEVPVGEKDGSWIHRMRFKDLDARGRWVGLRIYGGAVCASDELYVFGKPASASSSPTSRAAKKQKPPNETETGHSGFSVSHPQPYFHKPYVVLATNFAAPFHANGKAARE